MGLAKVLRIALNFPAKAMHRICRRGRPTSFVYSPIADLGYPKRDIDSFYKSLDINLPLIPIIGTFFLLGLLNSNLFASTYCTS